MSVGGNPYYPKNEKVLENAIDATLSFLSLISWYPLNAVAPITDVDQEKP